MNDLRAIIGWLGHEARLLLGWLRELWLWGALLVGLLLWSLAYQVAPSQTLHIGGDPATHLRGYDTPFLSGFNDSEPAARDQPWWQSPDPPYRWSRDSAEIRLPGVGGGSWLMTIKAASSRPDGSSITSQWQIGNRPVLPLEIGAAPRRYHLLGPAESGDLWVILQTPRLETTADPRNLGLVVYRVSVDALESSLPRLPPPGQLGLLAAICLACYGLGRRLLLPKPWAGILIVLLALGFAWLLLDNRLGLTITTPPLALLGGICYLLAVLLIPLLDRIAQALGITAGAGERYAALAATLAAFVLRMAGLLHPYARSNDLGFHANNLLRLTTGKVFLTGGLPCEAGAGNAPYPPAEYLVLAPAQLLLEEGGRAREILLQGSNALFESSSALLIWLALRHAGAGRRAALFGAALYTVAPPLLRSYSIGEMANVFAQALLMPLLLLLVFWPPRKAAVNAAILGAVLLGTLLLSHTGVTISVLCMLAVWLPLHWLLARHAPNTSMQLPLLVAAGAGAALVAGIFFYSAYAHLPAENRANALALAARQPPLICPPGAPLGQKLINTLSLGVGASGSIALPLLVAGALGIGGTRRIDGPQKTLGVVLVACWLGTLLSFATLLTTDQAVRWAHFLFPALCLGGGIALGRLMRRGRAGAVLALITLGYMTWFGIDLWVRQLVDYLH